MTTNQPNNGIKTGNISTIKMLITFHKYNIMSSYSRGIKIKIIPTCILQ